MDDLFVLLVLELMSVVEEMLVYEIFLAAVDFVNYWEIVSNE